MSLKRLFHLFYLKFGVFVCVCAFCRSFLFLFNFCLSVSSVFYWPFLFTVICLFVFFFTVPTDTFTVSCTCLLVFAFGLMSPTFSDKAHAEPFHHHVVSCNMPLFFKPNSHQITWNSARFSFCWHSLSTQWNWKTRVKLILRYIFWFKSKLNVISVNEFQKK